MRTLRQGRYPYVASRFRVRKSKLLDRGDYEKMLKMDIHTMIKFLEDKGYMFEEIGEKNPYELVERSVNLNLEKEFSNILKITQGNTRKIFELYLLRYDIENVKTLLRCKASGVFQEDIFICAGRIDRGRIASLKDATPEEILFALRIISDKEAKQLAKLFEENKLSEIENYLDKKYYSLLGKVMKKIKGEGNILKKFVKLRLDILNLRILYRFKKAGFRREEIIKMFVYPGSIGFKELSELAGMELADIHSRIISRFGETFKEVDIKKSLGELDAKFEVYQLRMVEKLMHAHPLSIAPLIAYVIMKEAEGRNIKLIARSKYYQISEEEIRKNLAVM